MTQIGTIREGIKTEVYIPKYSARFVGKAKIVNQTTLFLGHPDSSYIVIREKDIDRIHHHFDSVEITLL